VLWTVGVVVIGAWLAAAAAVRARVVRPLQTLANLLAALREGDYSIHARAADLDDPLGLAFAEVNALREPLRAQRLGALEAAALLQRVMEEIDVAVFAVDEAGVVRLANRAGERLLGRPSDRILGRSALALGLSACLTGEPRRVLDAELPADGGRWELRRSSFRQGGVPMQLLVLTDLRHALREEERQAWQRLVRVLSHEINNSLAPIASISQGLQAALLRSPGTPALDDLRDGLGVISRRSDSLQRFMENYGRLARLPPPEYETIEIEPWLRSVALLEERVPLTLEGSARAVVEGDPGLLEQAIINLVRNAADASLAGQTGVGIAWTVAADQRAIIRVTDAGPGIADGAVLFVPFFTTKPAGSGIGLVLSREIVESHDGSLTLENRADAKGCVATIILPRARLRSESIAEAQSPV